jgi:hypothetical protein
VPAQVPDHILSGHGGTVSAPPRVRRLLRAAGSGSVGSSSNAGRCARMRSSRTYAFLPGLVRGCLRWCARDGTGRPLAVGPR